MRTVYVLDRWQPGVVHIIAELEDTLAADVVAKVRSERVTRAAQDRVQALPADAFAARYTPTSPNGQTGVLADG